jgi:catechol 2,3-dioxygenase-like lactoylglutathione lyase family enzyme
MTFGAAGEASVDDFHAAAVAAGHPVVRAPAEAGTGAARTYAAAVRDPDRNTVEVVHRMARTSAR